MAVASIPEARGQGVGRRLIESISKIASERYSQLSPNVHLRILLRDFIRVQDSLSLVPAAAFLASQ